VCVIVDAKGDGHFRINTWPALASEICARIEGKPIRSCFLTPREFAAPSIRIGCAHHNVEPCIVLALFQPQCDADGRLAEHCIKDMRRNCTHSISHFPKRICVICRCCSAASCNSVSLVLPSRRRRIASISSALFPVAHTMYVNPKRSS